MAYLRPNYSKVLVDLIQAKGGRPFLTDCNTLYVGRRKNALDHLDAAYENGYNPFHRAAIRSSPTALRVRDEVLVPIDGEYVKEAKIGRAMMDADIVISLTHFKGHESTGFGEALKNLGMGRRLQSRKDGNAQCRQALVDTDIAWAAAPARELRPRGYHH